MLSLLQDDQMLASDIVSLREAIWRLLSDPEQICQPLKDAGRHMRTHIAALAYSLFVLAVFAVPSFAQDEEALKKDLAAVIALQGLPCGQVVAVRVQAESDFAVSCRDGNMYRVYLNAAGRVVVETRTASNEREASARSLHADALTR